MPTHAPPPEGGAQAAGAARSDPADPAAFSANVIAWQLRHGRHDLPWQNTRDPYRIWLSEIMLQQTQVATVPPYYARFLARFPDLAALAGAPLDDVMVLWSGLGYYGRARNLHACAQRIVAEHGGVFPREVRALAALPGVGPSTAAAIAVFAFGARAAILDGNVKRLFARCFGIEGWPGAPAVERALWARAQDLLPPVGGAPAAIVAYTQGLMDLGATICTRGTPQCARCPLAAQCVAHATGRSAQLPEPRPRKAAPLRSTHVLVALCAGEVLVEKRPPVGIWGGLWSLPQFDTLDALRSHALDLGARDGANALPERSHAFTHFTLRFTPHVARIETRRVQAEAPGRVWLPLAEIAGAALPAPVRKLLAELRIAELRIAEPRLP